MPDASVLSEESFPAPPGATGALTVGVISDTHGYQRPAAVEALRTAAVAHILHAGDVVREADYYELEQVAPVTAVAGNNDDDLEWLLKPWAVVTLAGVRFAIAHERRDFVRYWPDLADRFDVAVFGHSHVPHASRDGRLLWINPGSTYSGRRGNPRSLAVLHVSRKSLRVTHLAL